ncbi:MAG: alanine--glyoxylate aminotransferase family protein, partial [Candidatus Brockarchaeota archaeon]|nr:alanine--glyoxylate aminotransferase family protein [Candidatus Brockarchaeota archaeon]
EEFHELYREIQEGLKYAFRTKNDVLPLTASGTGAAECAVSNFVEEGSKVLVPVNGEFAERLATSVERAGGVPVKMEVPYGEAPTFGQVKEALDLNREVDSLFLVHNETTARDLKEIAGLCRREGVLVVVDAISDLFGEELENDEWGVNVCFTASQKCLAAPPGLSLISVDEAAWERIGKRKSECRSLYFDLARIRRYHQRGETPYTPSVPLFRALNEALKALREEGYENRIRRHKACARALYSALRSLGLEPYPRNELYRSNTVLVVKVPRGVENAALRRSMKDNYGVVVADGMGKLRGETFRIGSMGAVSRREVAITIAALGEALRQQGYAVEPGRASLALESSFREAYA